MLDNQRFNFCELFIIIHRYTHVNQVKARSGALFDGKRDAIDIYRVVLGRQRTGLIEYISGEGLILVVLGNIYTIIVAEGARFLYRSLPGRIW